LWVYASQCGDAAGQEEYVWCSRHTYELPVCSSCKSTTLPQTWHHAHCGFTVTQNRGASQIGQIKNLYVRELYIVVLIFSTGLVIGAFEHTSKRRLKCTSCAFQIKSWSPWMGKAKNWWRSIASPYTTGPAPRVFIRISFRMSGPQCTTTLWFRSVNGRHLPAVRVATPVVHSLPAFCFPRLFW
jgi:hypothetical protein